MNIELKIEQVEHSSEVPPQENLVAMCDRLLRQRLHSLLYDVAWNWALHTQEVEGVNSVLKYTATLSPNISFKLLASRITVKKLIASCKTRAERNQLIHDCTFFHHECGNPRT